MLEIFNSNVFIEIGEAIGNVGRRLLRKRRDRAELVDTAYRNLLTERTPALNLALSADRDSEPRGEIIEATYRVLTENGEEVDDERGRGL